MFKALKFVVTATVLLCIINIVYKYAFNLNQDFIPFPILIIIGTISLCGMMIIRITVKYLYNQITYLEGERTRVIILGDETNSFLCANILKNEVPGRYNPVAILSLKNEKTYDHANGIPVELFDRESVSELFSRYNADTLLFSQEHLETMRNGLADIFLNNNIRLKRLNQVEEYDLTTNKISHQIRQIKVEDLLGRPEIKNINPQISAQIKGKRVLISGAAGSIGSEIVRQIASIGPMHLTLIDNAETPMNSLLLYLNKHYPNLNYNAYVADIRNEERLKRIFDQHNPEIVYHAAAYKHVPMMEINPTEAILTNLMGSKNLADVSISHKVEKFVMISTDKAVNPSNVMGASKRLAEIYVQSLFNHSYRQDKMVTKFITTRFGNVLGSNGSVIPLFREQIENGGPVTVTHREINRYFMTIQEACQLVLEAGCMGNGGEIYIFDMGKPIKIYDLAKQMIQLAGLTVGKDIEIVETGLRPGEKLYEELLNDKEKTISTDNNKIMIANVKKYDFNLIEASLDSIIELAHCGNTHDMIYSIKQLIPEYISNNSIYQQIDNEINNNNKR